jgi:adenine-specific DNA-methyltransferase
MPDDLPKDVGDNPLSPRERAGVRAKPPTIRAASLVGGRSSDLPRKLRAQTTDAEARLWFHLRKGQLAAAKFRRQQAIGPYIVDFYCHAFALVIEIDGGHHFEEDQAAKDSVRSEWLEARGLKVLRFTNIEVLKETNAVQERILIEIEGTRPSP